MAQIIGKFRRGECKKCGKCCKYDRIVVQHPSSEEKKYYEKRAIQLWEVSDGFVMIINSRCPYLAEDNTCSIWSTDIYPDVCRLYPKDEKSMFIEDCGFHWKVEPLTPENKNDVME